MDISFIKNNIEECLRKLTIDIDSIEVTEDIMHPVFHIHTKDSRTLIGNKGETLHAFNHIVKKIVEGRGDGDIKFLIDVNRYYAKRIDELKREVQHSAERAKSFNHEVELHPMNSYERMIVHSLFSDDPSVTTTSEGEGKFRYVVIYPKGKEKEE